MGVSPGPLSAAVTPPSIAMYLWLRLSSGSTRQPRRPTVTWEVLGWLRRGSGSGWERKVMPQSVTRVRPCSGALRGWNCRGGTRVAPRAR